MMKVFAFVMFAFVFVSSSNALPLKLRSRQYLLDWLLLVNQDDCLAAHNAKRALHGVPDLEWNSDLASQAAEWALYLANNNLFQHSSSNGAYGENIYTSSKASWGPSGSGQVGTCSDAVEAWYDEIKDYNFNNPGFASNTGHFTQVVWQGTTQVGVGISTSTSTDANGWTWTNTYVVAQYKPPGNMLGQFAENVPNLI